MADTHGFDTVVEATRDLLIRVLRGAWKSAECPVDPGEEGRIPEHKRIEPGLPIGAFTIAEGDVHIPQEELDAVFLPEIQGAELKLGLHIQAVVQDPPVPSARLLEMTADLRTKVPIGLIPGTKNVGLLLSGLPRANVSATLTSGDPLAGKLNDLLSDFVHAAYENGAPGVPQDPHFPVLPHEQSRSDQTIPLPAGSAITYDAFTELFDDPGDPARRIETTVVGSTVTIGIPLHLKVFRIRVSGPAAGLLNLEDPMGIETRLVLTAPLTITPGRYAVDFTATTAATGPIAPAGPAHGEEGPNYSTNKARLAIVANLDTMLSNALADQGRQMAQGFGARGLDVPTVAQIEGVIGDLFFADLAGRENIGIWTPEAAAGLLDVNNVTTFVRADALAIAINAGAGADASALSNFVPASLHFAIAISRSRVDAIIADSRRDEGLAPDQLPKRFNQDGKDVDLNSLDVAVTDGAIRLTGMVTVIDAILDSIDVDADFTVDVGFHWEPNAVLGPGDAPQMMRHHTIGEPEVDPHESVLLWVITIILAVITLGAAGALGALIVVIVALIVRGIAGNIGGDLVVDAVSGAVVGISGWPSALSRIGRVRAVFHDPVVIESTGLVVAGTMQVISSCEATTVARANSGGPYIGTAASALTLAAGTTAATAEYAWSASLADAAVPARDLVHVYPLSGHYIARHSLAIAEPGGVTTMHYALVDVSNVPPVLDAGPDLEVDEGQVVTLIARFTDLEYADTHEAVWNFGDAETPQRGLVTESNTPPRAAGTVRGEHAWCSEGRYTVTLTLRDQNGGVAVDTLTVTVRNLPPLVEAGPDMFAYPCTVLTLTAAFTDPGWCDRHIASWNFGVCAPPQTAVVVETHEPPAGRGTATASTVYDCCGTYQATCEVTDDAGATGSDSLIVRVVTLANPGFEEGYRATEQGRVANGWQAYATWPRVMLAGLAAPERQPVPRYACEECVVHGGQRSQQLQVAAEARAGIWQRLGANPGWEYQFTAWVLPGPGGAGKVRLGMDPAGGDDAAAPGLLWSEAGGLLAVWTQLCIRGTAVADAVTLFLDAEGECEVWFDDIEFVARQPFCPPAVPRPEPRERCATFEEPRQRETLGTILAQDGFLFESRSGMPLAIISYGEPAGRPKLMVTPRGVVVRLPWPSRRVQAAVSQTSRQPFTLRALDAMGAALDEAKAPTDVGLYKLAVAAPGIIAALIEGHEGGLLSLCADPMLSAEGVVMPFSKSDPSSTPSGGDERMDRALRSALRRTAESDALPVVISLRARKMVPAARPDRMERRELAAQAEAQFAVEVRPLISRLESLGATEIRPTWISRSIAARLRPAAIRKLAVDCDIGRIALDEPRRILLDHESGKEQRHGHDEDSQ
ncbi:PKD domain-containing protein [Inquilinus limosus]|uniref:PKD domain-containing protein n=1 Tax=Inquilinus limosus TaxID=171674 RepID=UPI003F169CFE